MYTVHVCHTTGPKQTFCIDSRTNASSLTLDNLTRMINTVDLVFGSLPTHDTYLATNFGERIFSARDHTQAYFKLFETIKNPKPDRIWMTQSPCLVCAKRLISEYSNPDSIRPTLHIASIYTGNSLLDTVESMKCLAKMVYLNFTILPWDWMEFRGNIDHADCIDSIDVALKHSGFNEKRMTLSILLDFIHELAMNPQVSTWCI